MATSESVTPNLYAETLPALPAQHHAASRDLFRSVVTLAEVAADFLACVAGVLVPYLVYFSLHADYQYPAREVAAASIMIGLFFVFLLHKDGAYQGVGSLLGIRETERVIRVSAQSALFLLPLYLLADLKFSPAIFLTALVLIPAVLIVEKMICFSIVRLLNLKGYGTTRVVVYGTGEVGRRIVSAILCSPQLGLSPVAVVEDDPTLAGGCMFELGYRRSHSVPVHSGPLTAALLKSCQCDLLIMPMQKLSAEARSQAAHVAKQAGSRVAFLAAQVTQDRNTAESIDLDGLVFTSSGRPARRWQYVLAKRSVDVVVALLFLVLLAPLLFLIALLVRLDSRGPALFVQKRVGRDGRLFNIYKFRSMYANTPHYDFSPIDTRDRRITKIGRLLRRTSLDELPQLINVLRGEMSLVGPRPEMPFIVQRYNARQRHRLQVIPGITGMWQLSADRAFQIHENIQYDLYYIRHRTFFMDISILIHTLFFAMRGV